MEQIRKANGKLLKKNSFSESERKGDSKGNDGMK